MTYVRTLSASLAVCAIVGCSSTDRASSDQTYTRAKAIENYRRLDLAPPPAESAPDRYVDAAFGFSYAKPETPFERFNSEWRMSKASSSMAHGVFVFRANKLDETLPEVALYTNIVGESSDAQQSLAQFRSRFTKEALVSFEEISINGRPAAIAQYRMINPIDTFMMYQSFIPDSNRSISTIAYSPVREFGSFKETFRKVIMSTEVTAVPKRQRPQGQSGEGC